MKKRYPCLILTIMLLLSSGCSSRYDLDKPSLLLQYYEYPNSWGGIILGQSSWEETVEKLESMDFLEGDRVIRNHADHLSRLGLHINLQEGYREENLSVWITDAKAQAIDFDSYYTLAEIQENLGEIEKFVVYGWMYERPMMNYYGYSSSAGYIIEGWPHNWRNLNELEEVTVDENSVFRVSLFNPDQLMNAMGIEMGTAERDFFIREGAFQDWRGYGEFEVIRAQYDIHFPPSEE